MSYYGKQLIQEVLQVVSNPILEVHELLYSNYSKQLTHEVPQAVSDPTPKVHEVLGKQLLRGISERRYWYYFSQPVVMLTPWRRSGVWKSDWV